jgi:hypothetical protein
MQLPVPDGDITTKTELTGEDHTLVEYKPRTQMRGSTGFQPVHSFSAVTGSLTRSVLM